MKTESRIYRVGNSLGFTIPVKIVKHYNLKDKQLIKMLVKHLDNSKKLIELTL